MRENIGGDSCFPQIWNVLPLKKISISLSEKVGSQELETLSISSGKGFVNQAQKFGKELSGNQYVNYTVLRNGDFSYNKGNSKTYPQGCIYRLDDREIAAVPSVFNSFRLKNNICNSDYYAYLFVNGYMNHQLYRLINVGVRNDGLLNLYTDDFYGCLVPVPPLLEQEKIAEILNQCDKVIELKQQLIEDERNRKKWLMQNLLGPDSGVRLPGFAGRWKKTTLGNIGKFCGGGTPRTSESNYWDGTIPWVSSADIVEGDIYRIAPTRFITQEGIDNSATQICPKGSIIIVSRVGVGKLAIAPMELCTSQDFTNIVSMKANNIFLATLLQDILAKKKMQGQGTSIKGITVKEIKKMELHLPTIEEQNDIADLLFSQDQMIDLLEQELAQWQQKKKALMQLLLTGIVRVSV